MSDIEERFFRSVEKVKDELKSQVQSSPTITQKNEICQIALDLQEVCDTVEKKQDLSQLSQTPNEKSNISNLSLDLQGKEGNYYEQLISAIDLIDKLELRLENVRKENSNLKKEKEEFQNANPNMLHYTFGSNGQPSTMVDPKHQQRQDHSFNLSQIDPQYSFEMTQESNEKIKDLESQNNKIKKANQELNKDKEALIKDFQTMEYDLKNAHKQLTNLRAQNEKMKTELDHQNLIQDTVKTQNTELVGKQKKLEIKTKIYADKVHRLEEDNDELYQKIITMETMIEKNQQQTSTSINEYQEKLLQMKLKIEQMTKEQKTMAQNPFSHLTSVIDGLTKKTTDLQAFYTPNKQNIILVDKNKNQEIAKAQICINEFQDNQISRLDGNNGNKVHINRSRMNSKWSQNYSTNQIHLETISYNNKFDHTPKLHHLQSGTKHQLQITSFASQMKYQRTDLKNIMIENFETQQDQEKQSEHLLSLIDCIGSKQTFSPQLRFGLSSNKDAISQFQSPMQKVFGAKQKRLLEMKTGQNIGDTERQQSQSRKDQTQYISSIKIGQQSQQRVAFKQDPLLKSGQNSPNTQQKKKDPKTVKQKRKYLMANNLDNQDSQMRTMMNKQNGEQQPVKSILRSGPKIEKFQVKSFQTDEKGNMMSKGKKGYVQDVAKLIEKIDINGTKHDPLGKLDTQRTVTRQEQILINRLVDRGNQDTNRGKHNKAFGYKAPIPSKSELVENLLQKENLDPNFNNNWESIKQ